MFHDDTPEKMEITHLFWEICKSGKYDIFVSPVFFREMNDCPQPKLGQMYDMLGLIAFEELDETDEVRALAAEYIRNGVLTKSSYADCLHVAHAVVGSCDFVVSWNYDHLVKVKTIQGVKVVNVANWYNEIGIVTPEMLI